MFDKIFYKMRMAVSEGGLVILTEKWFSIHETPCFHYCVSEFGKGKWAWSSAAEGTPLQIAKHKNIPVKRVSKESGRFAFDTKGKAFDHLRFLKKKQLAHIERDREFISAFLIATDGKPNIDRLTSDGYSSPIPNTESLVNSHFVFD